MKIKMETIEHTTLEEFADRNGLTMVIRERTPHGLGERWHAGVRFYASFEHAEVSDGHVLISTFGNGATPEEAMENYAREISARRLVLDARTPGRRAIDVPHLVSGER